MICLAGRVRDRASEPFEFEGVKYYLPAEHATGRRGSKGVKRLAAKRTTRRRRQDDSRYKRYADDFPLLPIHEHLG